MKQLLLGMGNDLLCDDAIGLRVVREVRQRAASREYLTIAETTEMGLALLDLVVGFSALVIVDAVQTGSARAGSVHEFGLEDLSCLPAMSPHFLGIRELLALGQMLELPVPTQVKILGIEVQDPFTVSTQMTQVLETALPNIVDCVSAHCHRWS